MSCVSDPDDILEIVEVSEDVGVRMAGISILMKDVKSLNDAVGFYYEIDSTIGLFLDQILSVVPQHIKGFESYIFEIFEDYDKRKKVDAQLLSNTPRWEWPVVRTDLGKTKVDGRFKERSALKIFGYTVGKVAGWPEMKRRKFLSDFIECQLPNIVFDFFGDEYGEPFSSQRLRRVATVLASNASLRLRSDPVKFAYAISDWKDDLDFLRKKYYVGMDMRFEPWHTVSVS